MTTSHESAQDEIGNGILISQHPADGSTHIARWDEKGIGQYITETVGQDYGSVSMRAGQVLVSAEAESDRFKADLEEALNYVKDEAERRWGGEDRLKRVRDRRPENEQEKQEREERYEGVTNGAEKMREIIEQKLEDYANLTDEEEQKVMVEML